MCDDEWTTISASNQVIEPAESEMLEYLEKRSLAGYTFVWPSLSVGNVAQLATDLIIETLRMEKIAIAWHPAITPIVGPTAYSHQSDSITYSCEIFVSAEAKLAVLQLRAPVAAKLLASFIEGIVRFVEESKFDRVILLSSCFAHERHDPEQLKLEYICNESFKKRHDRELAGFLEHNVEVKLPGMGFATEAYQALLLSILTVPVAILFAYVSEGDNIPDSRNLSVFLNKIIAFLDPNKSFVFPTSWRFLFGNDQPVELF